MNTEQSDFFFPFFRNSNTTSFNEPLLSTQTVEGSDGEFGLANSEALHHCLNTPRLKKKTT